MTTPGPDAVEAEVRYEGAAPTFGGYDAADFIVRQPHQPALECNLGLAQDARALFEERAGALDEEGVQTLLRALAARLYRGRLAKGQEIPAILLVRARDVDRGEVEALLTEAALLAEAGPG